jgi:malate dehydrogenase (oxaloacetate-decarboxylating)
MIDEDAIDVDLTGPDLLSNPLLNKGTAFTESERDAFGLHGFLPPHVGTLEDQISRRVKALRAFETDFERYVFLRGLQDANETLFYGVIAQNLEETLPLVYTPTVGEGCQEFSHVWSRPRGLFLSWPQRNRIKDILAHPRFDAIEAIVVSDGERILGLGDQGAGGMGIPIGKLSLYTACAGLHPATTLPIMLDTGTDNPDRLADPLYLGWKHERLRGQDYDDFVEAFVSAVVARWPHVLLQWEDFARGNAGRLLARYRDRLCTFNDDIQGTAAVAAGALLAAVQVTKVLLREQRIVIVGAGSAGCGIGALILREMIDDGASEAEARGRFFAVDRDGLLVQGMPGILEFQKPFVQAAAAVADWRREHPDRIGLADVVANAKPTVLIGVSGQPGMFTEEIVRTMAKAVARPVIFPLSNPVTRCEATPQDLETWSDGRAVIGTGSPFPPVVRNGKPVTVDQTNNAYVFPGVGLGALAVDARRVSDGMFKAAARALAGLSPARLDPNANLLPRVADLRRVAIVVAQAVAQQACAEGLCPPLDRDAIAARIAAKMWTPTYRPYRLRRPASG